MQQSQLNGCLCPLYKGSILESNETLDEIIYSGNDGLRGPNIDEDSQGGQASDFPFDVDKGHDSTAGPHMRISLTGLIRFLLLEYSVSVVHLLGTDGHCQ